MTAIIDALAGARTKTAQKVVEEWEAAYPYSISISFTQGEHLRLLVASAIARATAASEARTKAEIDELSHLVQAECDNAMGLLRRAESAEARVRAVDAALFPANTQETDGSWTIWAADENLDAVIIDLERQKADSVCIESLKRILEQLYAARRALGGAR